MAVFKSSVRLITSVEVDGKSVRVEFKPDIVFKNEYRFTTDNKKVADAIRRSKSFDLSIVELKPQHSLREEEVIEVDPDVTIYEDVKKTQEAIKILNKDYGVDITTIGSKAAVKEKAKELKVLFPNL